MIYFNHLTVFLKLIKFVLIGVWGLGFGVWGGQNAEPVIAALNRNAGELRHQINRSVTLKFSPKLKFVLDRTFDNLDEARRIFDDETVQRDIAKDD